MMVSHVRDSRSILIEAEVGAFGKAHVKVGMQLPIQFASESGNAFPLVSGTVVSVTPITAPGSSLSPDLAPLRIEILLSLDDLAKASRTS